MKKGNRVSSLFLALLIFFSNFVGLPKIAKAEEVVKDTGTVSIRLLAEDDVNKPLEGAVFQTRDEKGKIEQFTTDSEGTVTISLEAKMYIFEQISSASGYDADIESTYMYIMPKSYSTITLYNGKSNTQGMTQNNIIGINTNLGIVATLSNGILDLGVKKFLNSNIGSKLILSYPGTGMGFEVPFVLNDSNGQPIEGGTFLVRNMETGQEWIFTSGSNTTLNLYYGNYELIQTGSSDGNYITSTPFAIEPSPYGPTLYVYGVQQNELVVVTNSVKLTPVTINKYNESHELLLNARFDLFPLIQGTPNLPRLRPASISMEDIYLNGTEQVQLAPGTYFLNEYEAPLGYNLLTYSFLIRVNEDGTVEYKKYIPSPMIDPNSNDGFEPLVNNTLDITNVIAPDKTTFNYVDESGNTLGGQFEIFSITKQQIYTSFDTYYQNPIILEDQYSNFPRMNSNILPEGNYVIRQRITPTGYTTAPYIYFSVDAYGYVTVNGDITNTITATSTRMDNVVNIKTIEVNGSSVIGAGYEIRLLNPDGTYTVVNNWTSADETHSVVLTEGNYVITEVSTPEGFVTAPDVYFTVNPDGTISMVYDPMNGTYYEENTIFIRNVREKVSVPILKVDSHDNPLPGARLALSSRMSNDLTHYWTSTTEAENVMVTPYLQYNVIEVQAPKGYLTSMIPTSFMVDDKGNIICLPSYNPGSSSRIAPLEASTPMVATTDEYCKLGNVVKVTNTLMPQVRKVDEDGNYVSGARLQILDQYQNVVEEWVSGLEPHYIPRLIGNFIVREIETPNGYEPAQDVKVYFSYDGRIYSDSVKGCPLPMVWQPNESTSSYSQVSSIALLERDPIYPDPMAPILLCPTDYIEVVNKHNTFPINLLKTDALGGGISGATLEVIDSTGKEVKTIITDGNPIELSLRPGEYKLRETKAPEGYYLASDIPFSISKAGDLILNGLIESSKTIKMVDSKIQQVPVTKVDNKGVQLKGATLQLIRDLKVVEEWVTDGTPHVLNIGAGTYTLREKIAPEGYILAEDKTFKLGEDGVITVNGVVVPELKVINVEIPRTVRILKRDINTGIPLQGAEFTLTQGDLSWTGITGADGYIIFKNMPSGEFQLKETKAPTGYVLPTDPMIITVPANVNDYSVAVGNYKSDSGQIDPIIKRQITVSKFELGNENNKLSGAIFKLEGVTDPTYSKEFTTDSNGYILFDNLPQGEYKLTEIQAPAGYIKSDEVTNIDLTGNTILYTFKASNVKVVEDQGSITPDVNREIVVLKQDKDTKAPLSGATFELYSEGTLLDTLTSDETGKLVFTGLKAGTYTVKEISAPDGYRNEYYTYDITLGEYTTRYILTVNNIKVTEGSVEVTPNVNRKIVIVKKDMADPKLLLQGAVFTLSKEGSSDKTGATDINGNLVFEGLEAGEYTLKEVNAPQGYKLQDINYKITLGEYTENYTLTVNNVKTSDTNVEITPTIDRRLVIVKKDKATGTMLPNAEFEVTLNGKVVGNGKTDANGNVVISNLGPGTYYVREIAAPEGYVLDHASYPVTIEEYTSTYTLVVNNVKLSTESGEVTPTVDHSIQITKVDGETGKALEGVEFTLYKVDGTVVTKGTTDGEGKLVFTGLEPATYSIKETRALDGYLPIDNSMEVVLGEMTTAYNLKVTNFKGNVDSGEIKPDINHSIEITKVDGETGLPLVGVEFTLYKADGTVVTKGTTDANGKLVFPGLDAGTYTVKETKALEGYLPLNKDMEVVLGEMTTVYTLNVTNIMGTVESEDVIPLVQHSIDITKVDGETGLPLAGVEFTLYKVDGTIVTKGTTDGEGKLVITDLEAGTYTIKETGALQGYLPLNKDMEVVLGEMTSVYKLNVKNIKGIVGSGEVTPTITRDIVVLKQDSLTKEILPGAKFELYLGDKYITEGVTGTDGTLKFSDLEPGTYYVKEVNAPEGYILDGTLNKVELGDGTSSYKLIVNNNKKVVEEGEVTPNVDHSIEITKLDMASGSPLSGVEFTLLRKDGSVITKGITDTLGKLIFTGLDSVTYLVRETKALEGYVPLTEDMEVVIGELTSTYKLTVNNVTVTEGEGTVTPDIEHSIEITKVDKATGEILPGVEFALYGSDGTELVRGTTDGEGKLVFIGLVPGTYTVRETKALEGYAPLTKDIEVVIGENMSVYNLHVENIKEVTGGGVVTPEVDHSLVITKVEKGTGKVLPGVEFTLYTQDGTKVISGTTDGEGKLEFFGLEATTYLVRETKALEGYAPLTKDIEVVIGENMAVYDLHVENILQGSGTDVVVPEIHHSLEITKVDKTSGKPLAGVEFTLYKSDGTKVISGITDGEGKLVFTGLEAITYKVKETKALEGYAPLTKDIEVVIGENMSVYNLLVENLIQETGTGVITPEVDHRIEITKVDKATGKPLAGVEFTLYKADGTIVISGITNSEGKLVFTGLEAITYKVKETKALEGYAPLTKDIEVVIGENMGVYNLLVENILKETGTGVVTPEVDHSLVITKVDKTTGKPLEGVEFTLYTQDGKAVKTGITDKEGRLILTGLDPVKYILKETKALEGYVPLTKDIEIVMGENMEVYSLHVENTLKETGSEVVIPEVDHSLVITKVDKVTGKPLQGVEFTLYGLDGSVIKTGVTDSNGKLVFTGLDPVKYIVKETKVLEGYGPMTENFEIVIGENMTTYELRVENILKETGGEVIVPVVPHSIVITKTDKVTGNPLSGVEFTLYTPNGDVVAKGVTDENGKLVFIGLDPITYHLKETKALDGYIEYKDTILINLEECTGVYNVEVKNIKVCDGSVDTEVPGDGTCPDPKPGTDPETPGNTDPKPGVKPGNPGNSDPKPGVKPGTPVKEYPKPGVKPGAPLPNTGSVNNETIPFLGVTLLILGLMVIKEKKRNII